MSADCDPMEMDGKIDLNDPDFYDTLNKELDSLMASIRTKKEQISYVESK